MVGYLDGCCDGFLEGEADGLGVGLDDGARVGLTVGSGVKHAPQRTGQLEAIGPPQNCADDEVYFSQSLSSSRS